MNTLNLPNKNDVRRSFDAAANTYDDNAFLQREVADRLFERLDYIKAPQGHMLDLGCGTGYTTNLLQKRYPEAAITALDLAPAMLAATRTALPKRGILQSLFSKQPAVSLLCADAESLPLADASLDFVLSSLTLQWCNPQIATREVARVLHNNGLFMFTTLGPDTLKELRAAFRAVDDSAHVNEFVDMHDIGDMLVEAGFADPVMDQEIITLTYSDLKSMLRELKGIGAHNVMPDRPAGLMGRERWQKMVNAYERFRTDGRLPATYEVIYGHAWMPAQKKQKTVDGAQAISLGDFKRMVMRKT
jgi:malonyl-CoA O-methyltransferase